MRILFMTLGAPYLDISQNQYTELVLEFHRRGYEIDLVTSARDKDISGLRKEAGVNVLRVRTLKLFRVPLLVKGLANVLLPYQYKRALLSSGLSLDYDLVIFPTPPITLVSLSSWFKKRYNSKVYLILRDIFPQNAVDLKMMSKKSFVYKYFRRKEKKMYMTADFIGCMSKGNIDYVLKHDTWLDRGKFHLLPNWRNLKPLATPEEMQAIREKYNLVGKYIVFFGGNLGKPQKIENIVALMEACKKYTDIKFIVVGNGTERPRLMKMIRDSGLKNVNYLGKVSPLEYHQIIQAADVGLISLSEDFSIPNIPSKTLSYFNAKKPILAFTDINTDYPDILNESKSGLWSEAGNTNRLLENLFKLKENKSLGEEMGLNGYNFMKDNLLTEMTFRRILSKVEKEPLSNKQNSVLALKHN